MPERVAAIVVTYNRKELLGECVVGLLNQTRRPDEIIVVNNKSTDGTPEFMATRFPTVTTLNQEQNLGGAGGFAEGLRQGFERGYDWIWVMDDDAEPAPDTLEKLLAAASKVGRQDVALCPLIVNKLQDQPQLFHHKRLDKYLVEHAISRDELKKEIVPIDGSAFVGPMFHRSVVEQLGYPITEYFIWCDDLEYTYRLQSLGGLFLVPGAVIWHKDKPSAIHPSKRFYGQRNYLHFMRRRIPLFIRDKTDLNRRIRIGTLIMAWNSVNYSARYLAKKLLKKQQLTFREAMLPLWGFYYGLVDPTRKPG